MMQILIVALVVLLAPILSVAADSKVLDIHYGANQIDINNDGVKDLITRVRWNTLTAHSFDEYTVAILDKQNTNDVKTFYSVPMGQGYEKMHFSTSEGAGCSNTDHSIDLLTGYRFELNKKGWLQVIKFRRPVEETYADDAPVIITTYLLTDVVVENADEPEVKWWPGDARFYLKKVKETVTKKKYCYVQDLMK